MSKNYFALLGLDPQFDVDATVLHQRYVEAQQVLNQENARATSSLERMECAQKIADLNTGYGCLKEDIARAYHLLFLAEGQHFDEDGVTFQDPQVLQEILDLHEAMSDADSVQKQSLMRQLTDRLHVCFADLKNAFESYDRDHVLTHLRRYSYFIKAQKDFEAQLQPLDRAC